ncbi:MAG: InlB B-repeat-containing protein [Bacteroidaceae bacterium]|nr:InlB B-repeat-containing protein [Bacteroidaceae bacterium]
MKKALISVFVLVFGFVNVWAEDYGFKVGGVSVTSSNCTNITGDNIKRYKDGVSYKASYNPSTKTLTLKNIKIDRTGSDNRAIYNTGCDGLTIVLDGAAYLKAANSSAVRCEKKTTIKCKNVGVLEDFYIGGDQENAIYLTNGITLTFDSAAVIINGGSNSSAIEGKNATEKIVVKNSSLYIGIDTGNEYYALRDIGSLQVQASAIRLIGRTAYQSPVKNLKAFSLSSGTYVLPSVDGEIVYNSTKGTFVLKSSGEEFKNFIRISEAVPIDEAHFPDATFRSEIRVKINDTYIIQKNPLGVDGDHIGVLKIYDNTTAMSNITIPSKGITSLKGIEYLPHVGVLYCQDNSLTSLDLSKNKELKNLDCSNNQLTTLKLPTSAPLASIACYNNKLTSLNLASFSSTLQNVYCSDNMLTSLTLPSSASQLTTVECWNNQLTSLKMPTDATNLKTLYCYGNKIYGDATTQFVNSLPQRSGSKGGVEFVDHSNANEGNKCTSANCITAESRGWILQHNDGTGWKQTNGCPHYFNLTYKVDGEEYKVLSMQEGASITPIEAPTKEGYTFSGWKNVPTTMPSNDVVVTGTFTANKYTLTYVVEGETYKTYEVAYGTTIRPINAPEKEGYTFSEWEGLPTTMPAHDVEVSAKYDINTYHIVYYVNDGIYWVQNVKYGDPVTPPDLPPHRKGYYFTGWRDVPETMPAHDVEIRDWYVFDTFTITYYIDGEEYACATFDYMSPITPLEAPTKEGYTFSGWTELPDTMPAEDIETHGSYTINKYTITYIVDGEEYTSETLNYGDPIIAPDAPIKEGSTFSGWSEIPATMPARNVTITATFAANPHTVTFYIDNEIFSTSILGYGAEILLPAVPDKVGYTFGGWKDVATTMPDHDLEYHAWYEAISYNLTYYVGGVIYKITSMKYGDPITHEEDPEDDDYFYAWEDEPTTMPNHDVDVHAVVTGIQSLGSRVESQENDVYYDLQGHKVTNPVKGNIYIRNKKKIVY